MAEANALIDLKEEPEDGTGYSTWSNLGGARHKDFPGARVQTLERARQRVQQAIAEGNARASSRSGASCPANSAETDETKDTGTQSSRSLIQAPEALTEPPVPSSFQHFDLTQGSSALSIDRDPSQLEPLPMHADTALTSHYSWMPAEHSGVPAWLAPHQPVLTAHPVPHAPADTLQGARDRLTSRWFALKGIFEGAMEQPEPMPTAVTSCAPVLAVFSLAGGVGKTSVVATLGRALSARDERVLLVETTAYGLLPFFFGARDRRPGVLRTFSPPEEGGGARVQMVTMDTEALGPETVAEDPLSMEIAECAHGSSRVIIDVATASATTAQRILRMSPTILVPVVPDMNSVVSTGSIDAFFHRDSLGKPAEIYYVLNQFNPSQPLHLDVREVLREQLGNRLLPFALRSAPAMSEALAEGMTVIDYAPDSPLAEDFNQLADWLKSISKPAAAPATAACRSLRWSER